MSGPKSYGYSVQARIMEEERQRREAERRRLEEKARNDAARAEFQQLLNEVETLKASGMDVPKVEKLTTASTTDRKSVV